MFYKILDGEIGVNMYIKRSLISLGRWPLSANMISKQAFYIFLIHTHSQ
jgi:hypothetical protein